MSIFFARNKRITQLIYILLLLAVFLTAFFYLPEENIQQPSTQPVTSSTQKTPLLAQNNDINTLRPNASTPALKTDTTTNEPTPLVILQKTNWKQANNFYDAFSQLKVAAQNGDAEAKYVIAANLRYCLSSPIDDAALQKQLDEVSLYGDAGTAIDNLVEKFNYCGGITQAERAQFFSYLEDAAHSGSIAAQESFASLTPEFYMASQGFKSLTRDDYIAERDAFVAQQVTFLNQSAQRGSELALKRLSGLYHTQNLTDNSLANSYAINRVIMELTDNDSTFNRYAWFEQRQYPLLSAEEQQSAEEIFEFWISTIRANGTFYPSKKPHS
ncbi:hypothetical protein L1286_20030 [Pseudoalteromonas sp. SMS1]|uniref:hypothetical protein n=1 Tax=Pseudoalteromonas sp. SMS1 TaxID=2908894 RepID=UPI001F2AF9B4|nr:hypothetical protein [Pseudoalteromonas sp. SMS1]MCF2859774.1 hypothetical protein [Pseudoalteromonas sp. SMS1]